MRPLFAPLVSKRGRCFFVLRVIIFGMVSLFYLFLFLYCQLLEEMTYTIYEVSKDDMRFQHTSYLSREPRVYPCKFFLAGVNFYRFKAKNWRFSV